MFDRIISLIGKEKFDKIKNSNVLVLGIGGVGGYAVETLIRSGVENITIVDYDKVDISNNNRQIIATNDNIGNYKVEEFKKRILTINNNVKVKTKCDKINVNNIDELFSEDYDFVIDACDTVIVKKLLIKKCKEKKINLITVCGMGKRLNPSRIKICDIRDTSYDPIAKILRKYVKDENIKGKVMCVFSSEEPVKNNNSVISSMMMVPSVAGVYAAYYVIDNIIRH